MTSHYLYLQILYIFIKLKIINKMNLKKFITFAIK